MSRVQALIREPLKVNAFLIVFAFGSVYVLPSQTSSSFVTFVLGIAMLAGVWRWRAYLRDPLLQLAIALQVYLAVSALWSEPLIVGKALSNASRVLVTVLFLVAFAEAWQTGLIQRWFNRFVAVCAGGSALVAIVVFFATDPEDGRLNGLGQLGTHVIAGLMWGVALVLLLDSLRQGHGARWRGFACVCGAAIVAAILLTASRNAWMSVFAGLAVYSCGYFLADRRRFLLALSGLAGLTAVLFLGLLLSDVGRELLLPRGDSFRPLIWSTILERVWYGNMVFGMGILTPDDVQNGPWLHPHPHSMYLAVLYQGGIVALVMFLALIALLLRALYRRFEAREAKVALAILAIALPSYVLDGHELVDRIGETWLLFWLPVALALSLRAPQPTQ